MKKIRIVFSLTLMLLLMVSSTAFATSISKTERVRNFDYSKRMDGSYSMFYAVGQNGKAYTTITNTTKNTYYYTADVYEYEYEKGYINRSEAGKTLGSGQQLSTASISRSKDNYIRFYLHVAKCSVSQYYSSELDYFSFKANQYYE